VADTENRISLKGKVKEIMDNERSFTIRILCQPDFVMLTLKNPLDLHLDDTVRVEGSLKIERIIHETDS